MSKGRLAVPEQVVQVPVLAWLWEADSEPLLPEESLAYLSGPLPAGDLSSDPEKELSY